jgi:hypothetical protein
MHRCTCYLHSALLRAPVRREPDPKKKLKDIYKFQEVQQVEVLARCCRKWVDEDTLDPEAIKLADHIIKVPRRLIYAFPVCTHQNSSTLALDYPFCTCCVML